MKLRNLVGITTLVLAVVVSAYAFAATGVNLDATQNGCPTCKTDVKNVPLPAAVVSQSGSTCSPVVFDYDNYDTTSTTAALSSLGLHQGYCNGGVGQGNEDHNVSNYRAIMPICDCITGGVATSKFDAGDIIGVRMTLLVDGTATKNQGVYWAGGQATIPMGTYASKNAACASPRYADTFGTVSYYTELEPGTNSTPGVAPTNCSPTDNQKLLTIQTSPLTDNPSAVPPVTKAGYQVTAQDITNQVSYWGIDIPAIMVTSAAKAGSKVSVKIELLDATSAGICSSCTPLCYCEIQIAVLGCEDGGQTQCINFPYVVTGIEEASGWSTGIAVANLDTNVTAPVLTFKLTDSTGAIFTAERSFTEKVGAWMLDTALANWTWVPATAPAPGAAMLQVSGNFNLDGYEFMTDGSFGAGTLPRENCN